MTCTRCELSVGAGRGLVNHLVAFHLLPPEQAEREALAPTPEKEDAMPGKQPPMSERTCGACGKKGHRRDHCKDGKPATTGAKPCGYCHRATGHSEKCPRSGGKKRTAAIKNTSSNGHGGGIGRALGELRAERQRLDGAIAALEALAE